MVETARTAGIATGSDSAARSDAHNRRPIIANAIPIGAKHHLRRMEVTRFVSVKIEYTHYAITLPYQQPTVIEKVVLLQAI